MEIDIFNTIQFTNLLYFDNNRELEGWIVKYNPLINMKQLFENALHGYKYCRSQIDNPIK